MTQLEAANWALQHEIAERKRAVIVDQMGADMEPQNALRCAGQPYVGAITLIAAAVQFSAPAVLRTQSSGRALEIGFPNDPAI